MPEISVLPTSATVSDRTPFRKMSWMPQIAKLTIRMPNRTVTIALPTTPFMELRIDA